MRHCIQGQFVLDLETGEKEKPPTVAPEGLLQALGELLLEALADSKRGAPTRREMRDVVENNA